MERRRCVVPRHAHAAARSDARAAQALGLDVDPRRLARELPRARAVRRDLRSRSLLERDRVAARAEPRATSALGTIRADARHHRRVRRGAQSATRSARPFGARADPRPKRDPETRRFFTLAPRGDYTDASVARLETENRIYRTSTGTVAIKYWLERDDDGKLCKRQPVDALWSDIAPLRHAASHERTGYPTQKPRRLLERVIAAGSPPGGLVVDLFAGSGTTGAAAARLGRRFVLGDDGAVAIVTMRSRLLREGIEALALERCGIDADPGEAGIEGRRQGRSQIAVSLT